MLVFISDLHFRDEGAFTVSPHMTEGFLKKTLVPQVRDARADEIEVVFLGDLIDINRSRRWVDGTSEGYRPWSHWRRSLAGLRNDARDADPSFDTDRFERCIVDVLDNVRAANAENYELWRRFKTGDPDVWGGGREFKPKRIALRFIPGNHDRLAQFSPAIRRRLTNDLMLDHSDPATPFDWIGTFPEYSAIALHGHLLDPNNFGGGRCLPEDPPGSAWYGMPCLGDVITVMFGIDLVHRCGRLPRLPADADLGSTLAEIDLVRPQLAAIRWLDRWRLTQDSAMAAALDDVVMKIIAEFMDDPFARRGLAWYVRLLYRAGIRPRTAERAYSLFRMLGRGPRSAESYTATMANLFTRSPLAKWIAGTHPATRYIVSGHTHRPTVISLSGNVGADAESEAVYFNTGTWQDVVEEGRRRPGGFARRQQITHVTLYREGEDVKPKGKRSYWEFWQGNLREGSAATSPVNGVFD